MKIRIYLLLIFTLGISSTCFSQTFFTNQENQFDQFTHTQLWFKFGSGLSYTTVSNRNLFGLNWNAGSYFDYYLDPTIAFRTGIEIDLRSGNTVFTDSTYSSILKKYELFNTTININYSCVKIPLGMLLNLTKKNKGFIINMSFVPSLGISGDFSVRNNEKIIHNRKAYSFDSTYNYKSAFNRLNLFLNMGIAYQLSANWFLGLESNLGLYDIDNLKGESSFYGINTHQFGLYFLYNIKKF